MSKIGLSLRIILFPFSFWVILVVFFLSYDASFWSMIRGYFDTANRSKQE